MKLAEIPLVLQRLRAGPAAWAEVTCAFAGEGETWRDATVEARHAALVALQYDRRPEDRELIVHLLQQELLEHRHSPFGGLDDSLRLAAFLAATLDDVELAWLMMEVKRANFDTGCGFDVEALFCCGVERTWAMVQASQRPEREAFIEIASDGDGEPRCTQEDVDRWWEQQRRDFPERWEDESVFAKLGLCVDLGDLEAGVELLGTWQAAELARVEPGSAAERHVLEQARSWWKDLRRPDEAARAQLRIDQQLPEDPWERASALSRAVESYAAAGWIEQGLERLALLRVALGQVARWQEFGLGRNAAVIAADVALAAGDDLQAAAQAFDWAEGIVADGIGRTLVLLEKLHEAAMRLGRRDRAAYYATLAEAERERISASL
jgi:hypothetical protein